MLLRFARACTLFALITGALLVPATPSLAATHTGAACDAAGYTDETDLRALIDTANDQTATPGSDTIHLQAGCTYTFTEAIEDDRALPFITTTVVIEGNGARLEPSAGLPGVGLFDVGATGSLTVRDVTLADWSVGPVFGGAAAIRNAGTVLIDDSSVIDTQGGALRNGGLMTIRDSTLARNLVPTFDGGAIRNYSSLIVQRSTFDDNAAVGTALIRKSGGAIFMGGGGALISDSTFIHNDAEDDGGAIAALEGQVAVSNSTFFQNSSEYGGGAISSWRDLPFTVTNSYFEDNVSLGDGGAIMALGNTSITNSTFRDNEAYQQGGAIYNETGPLNVTNATFSRNFSRINEGDAVFQGSTTGVTKNSIFDAHSHACYTLRDGGGNIVHDFDATCSGGFFLGDPELEPPAVNGNGTKTMKLGVGSKALDRLLGTACPSTDQRGQPRPAGPQCDIGAFEDQVPTTPGAPAITTGSNPSKTGELTLGWAGSTDADGPVQYRLFHKDANDAAASLVTTKSTNSHALTEAEGTYQYYVEAFDEHHVATSTSLTSVVVDRTRPAAPTLTPDSAPDYDAPTGLDWYADSVTIYITDNGDPSLVDGSAGSGVTSVTASQTRNTSGSHFVTGTATDAAGNLSFNGGIDVNVDAEDPTVTFADCPSTVLLHQTAGVDWSATDPSSGLATANSGSISLDTSTVGEKSVQATATDNVGHTTDETCTFNVIYDFTGFFEPVRNAPAVTEAAAGKVLTVMFSLAGNQGLNVIPSGYPQSVDVACDTFGEQTVGTQTTAATKQPLMFAKAPGGRYSYAWKTPTTWKDTCRQFILKLDDGTYHRANIHFG